MHLWYPVSNPRRGGYPHSEGRALHQFHMDLGDLGDAQLRQLMEDLQQEVAQRELNASPGTHPWAAGGPLQETGTPV